MDTLLLMLFIYLGVVFCGVMLGIAIMNDHSGTEGSWIGSLIVIGSLVWPILLLISLVTIFQHELKEALKEQRELDKKEQNNG